MDQPEETCVAVNDLDDSPRAGPAPEFGQQQAAIRPLPAYCVVAIGDPGHYQPALQLAAREAKHSGLAIRLVHGSRPSSGRTSTTLEAAVDVHRGWQLLNAAATELKAMVDDDVLIYLLNSPLTGIDALLTESLTAPLIVLQRRGMASGTRATPGSTMSAVAAQASCPVALAPSGNAGRVSVGLLTRMDSGDHSALARSPEWAEAGLRRVPLTVTHSWDGPFSHTLTSAHLPPSQKAAEGDRADDLRRLAAMVAALETGTGSRSASSSDERPTASDG
jgi:hypothetical protein